MALSLALIVVGSTIAVAAEHTKDSLDTVKKNLKEKQAILIDVREEPEWKDGHLQDARLVPLSKLRDAEKQAAATKELPKDKIIYCHCAAGRRSLEAGDLLKKQGFDVRPLKPGYKDLLNAGFPKAP